MKKLLITIFLSLVFVASSQAQIVAVHEVDAQTSSSSTQVAQNSFLIQQLLRFFVNILSEQPDEVLPEETLPESDDEEIIIEEEQEVHVQISYPPGGAIIAGSSNVPFMTFTIFNPLNEDLLINQLAFGRRGVGSSDDFESLTLFEGGRRIVSSISVNRSSEAVFRLHHKPLVIESQTDRTFTLRANIADIPGINTHENYFIILEDQLRFTGAETGTDYPPNIMQEEAVVIRTVPLDTKHALRITKGISVGNNTFLNLNTKTTFGYFNLNGESSENIVIEAITLQVSRHSQVIQQAYLEDRSTNERICELESIDEASDTITFTCGNGYILPRSQSRLIAIRGTLNLGRGIVGRNDTLSFSLDNPEDVIAKTLPSGFGVRVIDEY